MARTARKPPEDGGEVKPMDFEHAKKLYSADIKPAQSKVGEFMQEISTAFKAVKKVCHIQPSSMKAAIKLVEMEGAKRDDWLRGFNGFLRANGIDPDPKDLVDAMQGEQPAPKPRLVTVAASDGVDADLAGENFEASEEELATQEGRGEPRKD